MLKTITGVIGWVGTALVFGAVAIRFLRPEWMEYGQYMTWAGLVCILIYMLGQWRDVVGFYGTRQARYGTMSIVGIVVAIGIFAAVNYLGVRQTYRWDLTENQAYSLSEQTIRILQNLDEPVQFTVFAQEVGDYSFERYRRQLEIYQYESNQVRVDYVDVDRQPGRAKEAEITQYGTVVLTHKGREQRLSGVTNLEEQTVTNALIKLVSGTEQKIYFTQGHGERDTANSDRMRGYDAVSRELVNENFIVAPLPLAQQTEVPEDATVVVIAGPTTDFLPAEIDALERYLARGGKLLALIDPPQGSADHLNLRAFLREWSIELGNDVVVDASGVGQLFGGDASVPVVMNYPAHPITDRFQVMTAFPYARSVNPVEGGAHTPQPVLQTSARSWAETDLKALAAGKVEFTEGADRQGPVTLGLAVTAPATEAPPPPLAGNQSEDAPKPETRIVVIGDSDFAGNSALGIQGNLDLFLNTVNWLAQQEDLIAIRPRDAQDRRLTLTADQLTRVMLLSLFVIPGAVFAAGIYTWWRRR
jgi:ABC-type uncharacterized transport system involved in gliding motility auxiliary subunit